ncbi:MAG: YqaA family protein [candidate division KSB1 bacterium]|nr:YqaA family protein [candidate division KSB1 bacterium]MDQ7062716.1 YqaA family protein [candidate division KSB1 bacterium]
MHQGPIIETSSDIQTKSRNWVRRIYDWMLGWAETPYGIYALAILAFAESSFFPVPPDVLLIALAIGAPKKSLKFAAICTLASVIGGIAGYYIGYGAYEAIGKPIVDAYNGQPVMDRISMWYTQYGFWGILIAAITPIPYKIFTIASGVFTFHFGEFLLASVIGRSIRFFAVAGLIAIFGPQIKSFIDKYFNILSIIFTILLIGGFIFIKFATH